MILTYMFALMGIQSSPAFTLWNFGMKSPKPLAWQQVFMSTFVVGLALFFFTAFQGMGARILEMAGRNRPKVDGDVVPMLMTKFLPGPLLGIVFIGAIAAIHSTAAPYIGTGGTILLRDVYWRYVKKQEATHGEQIWVNRLLATFLTLAAVVVSLTAKDAIVMIGGFATAFGFIMYLLLLGVHWGFKFPSVGATLGLLAGDRGLFLTYYHLALPAVHAHRLLGPVRRPDRGLSLPLHGHQGQRRNPEAPGRGARVAGQRGRTQRKAAPNGAAP
jgi:SSS family solute:Na+ symporter